MKRLLELFEGPEAPGPWSPPEMPAALHALLPWRAWDESSELYVNAGSVGFMVELPPFAGIDAETLGALAGTLADAAPERCTVQVIHWASPRFGAASRAWAGPRSDAGGALARMGARRRDLLTSGGWRRLHAGGPPFTLSDYRVFVTACLTALPGPAAETALGAFRRALEGTLASAGASTRRLEPDALLSLAAELVAPDIAGHRDGGNGAPAAPLGAARSAARAMRRAGPRAHGPPHGTLFPSSGRGRHRRAGAQCGGVPGGLAGLARQRPDRRLPPRLPATGLPRLDLPHRDHRRRGRGREGVPQIRPRHPAGRHRHCKVSSRPARESQRLAGRHRAHQGRREAGPRLLHGGGVCAPRCPRRGRAGGARDLSRPGLAG